MFDDPIFGAYFTWVAEKAKRSVLKEGPKTRPPVGNLVIYAGSPSILVLVEDAEDGMAYVQYVREGPDTAFVLPVALLFDFEEVKDRLSLEIQRLLDACIKEGGKWN